MGRIYSFTRFVENKLFFFVKFTNAMSGLCLYCSCIINKLTHIYIVFADSADR